MRKVLKRKIKRITLLVITVLIISFGLITYNTLGPWRSFFWNLPGVMGFFGPRTYLVLLQNNNELRPTGGFISAVAEVNTLFGFPSIEVFDSYQIPNPSPRLPAPEPFNYFIGQNDRFFAGWTLRDSNFSPDFTTSSKDIIQLYQQAYPDRSIDGVIAIDFAVIEKLLESYGPITVEGVTFTPENFFIRSQKISKDIDTHDVEQLADRKSILKPFAKELIRAITSKPTRYGRFLESIHDLAQEKHVLAYSSSESFQDKLERAGLTNPIETPDERSDLLHVNIANIGGRKADRYVTKQIAYRADFSLIGKAQSQLEITLEHLGSYNIQSDIYQAYIRSYVPLNSKLLSSSGSSLRSTSNFTELGLTVFADYIRLKPGEKITLNYSYRLPETVLPEDYQLQLVKQPGTDDQFWHVAVRHINDSSLVNSPETAQKNTPMKIRENLALWQGELDTDRQFHIYQRVDTEGPIILWQRFVDLNTVNVRFQEQIDRETAKKISNFQIIDLNKENAVTDQITVTKAEFGGQERRDLWLTVAGATLQPEEHYQLILRDIRDVNDNLIEPNPLLRTLVQRIESENSSE